MPASSNERPYVPEIRSLLDRASSRMPVPGAAIGAIVDGQLDAFISHGSADLASGRQPGPNSIARVASVTKTFTATAIMQLRDASLLALDDPLLLHIPEFTSAQAVAGPLEGVTIRRLLTHHSGLVTEHPEVDWEAPEYPALERVLDSLETLRVAIPQDSQWKYSNIAYGLLGEVVTRMSGMPYADYVHERIIAPLGLENTAFDLSPEQQARKMTGYSPPLPGEGDPRIAPYAHLNGVTAAGQLQTNVEDLAKWVAFQLGDGPGAVLSKGSLEEMQRPAYIDRDWSAGQCIGWRGYRRGERVYHNHGGAVHGFSTDVIFNVPSRTGLVMLINMWPVGWNAGVARDIAEVIVDSAGSEKPGQDIGAKPGADRRETEFDGEYRAEPGYPLLVSGSASGLLLDLPFDGAPSLHAPARLQPSEGADEFTVVNGRGAGERVSFSRDESGTVSGFSLGGFRYRRNLES